MPLDIYALDLARAAARIFPMRRVPRERIHRRSGTEPIRSFLSGALT
jgi:hypothetical protein